MEFTILFQELVNSTETIRTLLSSVTQVEAKIKPDLESWSMLEVVCHLYDEEREDFREHLDFILHRQNGEWHVIDPEGWVTERRYNGRNFVDMQELFFSERSDSLKWLKGLSGANWETIYSSEDGSMKAGDMFASWVAHDNLHIRQLVELRRVLVERRTDPYSIQYAGDW